MQGPDRPGYTCAHWIAAALSVAMLVPHAARAQDNPEGKKIFETVCVACHTIGGGTKIGPDLKGVAERRDVDWIRQQIKDPDVLKKAGDSIATANRAQFGVPMPKLGLTDQQIDAVIAHMGAAPAAPASRPAAYFPTLLLALGTAAAFTLIALSAGSKRAETRA